MTRIAIRRWDATLTVRLQARAANHGRSIEQEALEILRANLQSEVLAPQLDLGSAIRRHIVPIVGSVGRANRESRYDESGMGAHFHAHHHATGRILLGSLVVTLVFVAVEALAGLRSGSLALLSDAGHNFTDAFGLGLAAGGFYFAAKPGDHVRTFGYQRMGVLAAFLNALLLVILSGALLWESYLRLMNPEPVSEKTMLWVAALGIVVNVAIAWSIGHGHEHDLNIRAAWIHQVGDAASCVGIIIGAVIIHYTGWLKIDPILSIVISLVIVWTAWDIFKDSLNILLEGLPKGLRLAEVTSGIRGVPGVIDVHDLHVWNLGAEERALSCHVLIEDVPPSASESILRDVNCVLQERFAIHHTTIQFEHTRCALADISCAPGRKAR